MEEKKSTTLVLTAALLFIAFSFCNKKTVAESETVYNREHEPMRNGGRYYIVMGRTNKTRVSAAELEGQNCPISVVLSVDPKHVIFESINGKSSPFIKTEEPLKIRFVVVDGCAISPQWRVQRDEAFNHPVVRVGPCDTNGTIFGTFKLKKYEKEGLSDAYVLFFNHDDDKLGLDYPVAAESEDHNEHQPLVVKSEFDDPLPIKFQVPRRLQRRRRFARHSEY